MPLEEDRPARRVLAVGASTSPVVDLVVPAVLLRAPRRDWSELVNVARAAGPTVAFSRRDLRSPGIVRATAVARAAGFAAVVRSPGGRTVAYDEGAVVIDHLTRFADPRAGGRSTFEQNAQHHAAVLRSLGDVDVRVGEVEGEYCPGEFSVNVGGRVKVVGSAQRMTGTGALFSTVVQVELSDRVRDIIVAVSAALGYDLRTATVAGLSDVAPDMTVERVASAMASDYRRRLDLDDTDALADRLPRDVVEHAARAAADAASTDLPLDVDAWARTHPLPAAATPPRTSWRR